LPDPSLRAARSRGHRNSLSLMLAHGEYRRYEQPDQEGIETTNVMVGMQNAIRRYEQPDQEGIETRAHQTEKPVLRRYEQPDQEGIETNNNLGFLGATSSVATSSPIKRA